MKKTITLPTLILLLMLSGCLYPNDRKAENQVPYPAQIEQVQNAVNRYQQQTEVLPIFTREADTPIYEKYIIDFNLLVPRFMESPPGNSFEKGGVFQYALIDVEQNPTVKLIDLRMSDAVRDLQLRVNQYLQDNYLPVNEVIDGKYFKLDYKALNIKEEPLVQSPFTLQYLSFIVNQEGRVGIDYRPDLIQALQERDASQLTAGQDIRYILTKESFFVPAYSFPYTLKNGEIMMQ